MPATVHTTSSLGRATRNHPSLVVLIVAGTSLMIVFDATLVNIALPSMGRYFGRNPTDMTWAVNAYTLTFGGLLLLGGRSGGLFGRRRMLIISLALFSIGSLVAGLAMSFEFLLSGRALQGVGAAIASPTALALISTEFAEGKDRNRAIAVYSAVAGAGAAAGLLLGGALTEYFSWRWVLLVNVPISVVLIALAYYYLGETGPDRRVEPNRFDIVGSLISVLGVVGLVYGFIHAGSDGWSDFETVGVLGLSMLILIACGFYEVFVAADPILPVRILANRNRSSAYAIILIIGASFFGGFYFLNFFAQGVLGYSALKAGFAFLPALAVVAISTQASAMLLPRFGPKALVTFGTVVLTGALLWLSRIGGGSGYLDTVLPATLVFAVGLGAVLVPLTAVVLAQVSSADAGLASATLNVGQQLGGSLGLAVLASVATTEAASAGKAEAAKLIAKYGLSEHVLNYATLASSAQTGTTPSAAASADSIARNALNAVQAQAYGMGFQTAAIFGAAAIVVAALGITRLRREHSTKTPARTDDMSDVSIQ